jgi:hypothetical protein
MTFLIPTVVKLQILDTFHDCTVASVTEVTLNMRATLPSETSVSIYKSTWGSNPEDQNLMKLCGENART